MSIRLNNGGRAFPCASPGGSVLNEGMSLRQWYAAHAPAVPEWFRCEFDGTPPSVPAVPNEWGADKRAEFALIRENGLEASGACGEVRAFWTEYEPARARLDAWRNRMREKKFFVWRWHYADMMLETEK